MYDVIEQSGTPVSLAEPSVLYRSRPEMERIATLLIDSAICVHRELGPGLLESIYQKALAFELRNRGLHVDCEQPLDVEYRGQLLGCGYRIDMIIEGSVIVENKTVKEILPIHKAQLLTYLKISKAKLGFILNWNQRRMRDGIKRMVLDYEG